MTGNSERLAHQFDLSAAQLRQRRDIGDKLDVAREIIHDGAFPTKEAAVEAGKELMAAGYRTEVVDADGAFRLEVHKLSILDDHTVNQFTEEVFAVMERHGGEYDGWGGEVIDDSPTYGVRLLSFMQRLLGHR